MLQVSVLTRWVDFFGPISVLQCIDREGRLELSLSLGSWDSELRLAFRIMSTSSTFSLEVESMDG